MSTKNKALAIDINGPFLDPIAKALTIERITDVIIPRQRFGHKAQVMEEFDITPEKYQQAMKLYLESPKWFKRNHRLQPGAIKFVHHMHRLGFEVFGVSTCEGLKEDWMSMIIDEYKLPMRFIKVDGKAENGKSPKTDFYAQCEFAIDDDQDHLTPLLEYYPETIPIFALPPIGGTGCDVISVPEDLDPRILVSHGLRDALRLIAPLLAKAA
jgi:hypothetical protein